MGRYFCKQYFTTLAGQSWCAGA